MTDNQGFYFEQQMGAEIEPLVMDIPGLGTSRPLTPLEEFVAAKSDLDAVDAERAHYHARYVKSARKALEHYTQAELAQAIGVSQPRIRQLIRKR